MNTQSLKDKGCKHLWTPLMYREIQQQDNTKIYIVEGVFCQKCLEEKHE